MTDPTRSLDSVLAAATAVRGGQHGREVILHFGDPAAEYDALVHSAGLADVSDRTQVELTGEDRASFLHNLCTNEIRRLAPGAGCEAFLTDAHGRVLGHVFVFVGEQAIVLDAVPGQGKAIVAHLDRYLIRERVTLHDRSEDWGELLLAGARCGEVLDKVGLTEPATAEVSCASASVAGHEVMMRRAPLVRPTAILLAATRGTLGDVAQVLREAGAMLVGYEAVETARIVAGVPWTGIDTLPKTLPQELARDERSISFTKGCYIGQETVARLDALGHVNKTLCGLSLIGREAPTAGTPLTHEGRDVGQITSATVVPGTKQIRALGYVKAGFNQPGTTLDSAARAVEVVAL